MNEARQIRGARTRANFRGCLIGGAVGDALGAAVEWKTHAEIKDEFGPAGLRDYAMAYGRLGAITDDTQMTLFTAEALLRAEPPVGHGVVAQAGRTELVLDLGVGLPLDGRAERVAHRAADEATAEVRPRPRAPDLPGLVHVAPSRPVLTRGILAQVHTSQQILPAPLTFTLKSKGCVSCLPHDRARIVEWGHAPPSPAVARRGAGSRRRAPRLRRRCARSAGSPSRHFIHCEWRLRTGLLPGRLPLLHAGRP